MERKTLDGERIVAEATEWFAALQEPGASANAQLCDEFAQWLLRSPQHVREFLEITRVWGDLRLPAAEGFSTEALVAAARATSDSANVTSLTSTASAPATAGVAPSAVGKPSRWLLRVAAAFGVLSVAVSAYFGMRAWDDSSRMRTAVGEQRSLSLADGSIVHLNTDTEIVIDIGSRERRIELLHGEGRFDVAKDGLRPFIVSTSQASVRALGTIFNVKALEERTAVTVLEGRVEVMSQVSPDSAPGGAAVPAATARLGAGQQAQVSRQGDIVPQTGPSVERALAWMDRKLVFREESLGDVVAEFNRYGANPVRIGDPALARLRISGTFATHDVESLLQYLEHYQGVRVRKDGPDGAVLLSRREVPENR